MKKISLLAFASFFSVIAFSQSVVTPAKTQREPKAVAASSATANTHQFMTATQAQATTATPAATQKEAVPATQKVAPKSQKHEAINSKSSFSSKTKPAAAKS